MQSPLASLRQLDGPSRTKAALLSGWFFLVITTLWLLKPIRSASLLVALYSRIVDRLSRLQVAQGASLLFAALLMGFRGALQLGGELLAEEVAR